MPTRDNCLRYIADTMRSCSSIGISPIPHHDYPPSKLLGKGASTILTQEAKTLRCVCVYISHNVTFLIYIFSSFIIYFTVERYQMLQFVRLCILAPFLQRLVESAGEILHNVTGNFD